MDTPEAPKPPEPAEGNTLSNLHVLRTTDAYVAIEHPADWTEDQVKAALAVRMLDLGQRVSFWSSDSRTRVKAVHLDEFDPDERSATPFLLTVEDLAASESPEDEEA